MSIVAIYAFQCCLAESFISLLLKMDLKRDILIDLAMSGIFIVSGWCIRNVLCMVIYAGAYVIFLLMHRQQAKLLIQQIKNKV